MTESGLTPKRERFAQELASGKNPSEAYRAAYDTSRMQVETIRKRASELAQNGDIRGRLSELRKPVAEAIGITLESHLADLRALRDDATEARQFSAAISAEIARGKHAGVVADDKVRHLGPDGGPIQAVTRIELVARKA